MHIFPFVHLGITVNTSEIFGHLEIHSITFQPNQIEQTIEETITRMKTQMTATEEKDDENLSLNELKHKGMMRDIYQMLGIALPIKTAILQQDLLYI